MRPQSYLSEVSLEVGILALLLSSPHPQDVVYPFTC